VAVAGGLFEGLNVTAVTIVKWSGVTDILNMS
jgi:hypothetical protein